MSTEVYITEFVHYQHSHENKAFWKKTERLKDFFIFMTLLSFQQVNLSKREPCERGCSWISDTVNIVLLFVNLNSEWMYMLHARRKKSVEWTTFNNFLRRANFILMFFQEELPSFLNAGKPFLGDLES